jgi:hypothetical protein
MLVNLEGDETRIKYFIASLIDNAILRNKAQKASEFVRVTASVNKDDCINLADSDRTFEGGLSFQKMTQLIVEVTDQGADLDSTQIKKIFSLQLSPLKHIVKSISGSLYAKSCNGETTFTLAVPCKA